LCTIDFLDKIIDSGTRVIKIEGRGRASEYVYTTTKCYREALDSIHAGTYSKEKIESWKVQLSTVYNRGFWDGYYLGRKMGEWSDAYGSKATKKKIYLAKGVKYYDQLQVAEFQCEAHKISVGDEIIISGPTTGYIQMEVDVIHVNRTSVPTAEQGQNFTIPMAQKIRPSDKLYKLVNS
jgi:putative protease